MNTVLDFRSFLTLIATLFVMLAVGFAAGKLKIITPAASKNLSRLIITIGQPALIIYSLVRMPYSASDLLLGVQTLAVGLGVHAFLAVLAYFAFSRFQNLDERKITELAAVFGNVGFIGIPLLESLFGQKGAFMGSFFVISYNLVLWTWGIAILARKRPDIKLTPKKIILNYGTVPSLIGIVIFILKGVLPPVLPSTAANALGAVAPVFLQALSYIASLCTPVSMLIIGALLADRTPKQIFGNGKIYYLCAVRLLLLPLLVCVFTKLLGFGTEWILFMTMVTAMPSATSVTMLAELYDINPGYSAQAVGTSSLLSIVTMPCVIWAAQKIIEIGL